MAKAARRSSHRREAHKKSTSQNTSFKKSAVKKPARKWSKKVSETSNALDLQQNVFKQSNPRKISQSLKRSANKSKTRKASPYQSAMSMLNFYINRGGKNLSASKKKVLEKSTDELRKLLGRIKIFDAHYNQASGMFGSTSFISLSNDSCHPK